MDLTHQRGPLHELADTPEAYDNVLSGSPRAELTQEQADLHVLAVRYCSQEPLTASVERSGKG